MTRHIKRGLWIATAVLVIGAGAAAAYQAGYTPERVAQMIEVAKEERAKAKFAEAPAPAVTVARVTRQTMTETSLVTGTLVPREEILVAPEVEGLRVIQLNVDVGDRVKAGDVLAILEGTQLEAQLAQNTAALARAEAAIAQAKSQIAQADAAAKEAAAQLERAEPLRRSGYLSESVFDQRQAAARSTAAQLVAARDGLKLAEAGKQEAEAARKEIVWRLGNTKVTAPRAGVVSRRTVRIGGLAAGAADPMFRIIADGEIELDAEATATSLARIERGQTATIDVAGTGKVTGTVRLVAPEVDRATRLGSIRIFIGDEPGLRIGAFGRGTVETASRRTLAIPAAAVQYGDDGASVLLVSGGKVRTRAVGIGLRSGEAVEVASGLAEGDLVVAKAGTFLRDGDAIRAVMPDAKVSEAGR